MRLDHQEARRPRLTPSFYDAEAKEARSGKQKIFRKSIVAGIGETTYDLFENGMSKVALIERYVVVWDCGAKMQ